MLVAFLLLRGEFPWPASLTWSSCPSELDDFQAWLLEQRTAEDPNLIFAIFDGFRALADWLVTALNDVLLWLTWVGTIAAAGADRAALRRLAGGADRGSARSRPSR